MSNVSFPYIIYKQIASFSCTLVKITTTRRQFLNYAAQLPAGRMLLARSILSVFSAAVLVGWALMVLCLDLDTSDLITTVRSQAAAVQSQGSSSSMLQVRVYNEMATW